MNLDNLRKWTAALRSGEYRQTKAYLAVIPLGENKPEFCCMGVGCEVAEIVSERDGAHLCYGEGASVLPPFELLAWLGIDDRADGWEGEGYALALNLPGDMPLTRQGDSFADQLALLNDIWELTFEQIADLVDYFGVR